MRHLKKSLFRIFLFTFLLLISCSNTIHKEVEEKEEAVVPPIHEEMSLGTCATPPRLANGRVDIFNLIKQLQELNANEYSWWIWRVESDWEDLLEFLPLAQKLNIKVWVSLAAPAQTAPKTQWKLHPYGVDYIRWAEEIAKLSVKYPNLSTLTIDDFTHDLGIFTPEYVGQMKDKFDKINPDLRFIPCSYYTMITQDFANKYSSLIDSVLFPYRAESEGRNLQNPNLVISEIEHVRSLFKEVKDNILVYLDVYSTAHSKLGATTPDYVRTVIKDGGKYADGVHIYTHLDPKTAKGVIVKEEFGKLSKLEK